MDQSEWGNVTTAENLITYHFARSLKTVAGFVIRLRQES
jgi:hypothetical protein